MKKSTREFTTQRNLIIKRKKKAARKPPMKESFVYMNKSDILSVNCIISLNNKKWFVILLCDGFVMII